MNNPKAHITREIVPVFNNDTKNKKSRSWFWFYSSFCNKDSNNCHIDILDTVFYVNGKLGAWFFTGKQGYVMKKLPKNLSPCSIYNQFYKISMKYPANKEKNIGIMWCQDTDACKVLADDDFLKVVESADDISNLTAFQNFVIPKGELDPVHFVNFEHDFSLNSSGRAQIKATRLALGNQRIPSMDTNLNNQMSEIINSSIRSVEKSQKCRIVNLVSLFLVDDTGKLFLCKIQNCFTIPLPKKWKGSECKNECSSSFDNICESSYHGPSAIVERINYRAKLDANKIPDEKKIEAILSSPTPKRRHEKMFQGNSSTKYASNLDAISAFKTSKMARRVTSATLLGSSQRQGCSGDYCTFRLKVRRREKTKSPFNAIRHQSKLRNQNTPELPLGVSEIISCDLDKSDKKFVVPFKYIAQSRAEKNLVDLFIRRYTSGEEAEYLTEEYYGEGDPLGESFAAHYYQDTTVCQNCYSLYTLLEEVRSRSYKKIYSKESNRRKKNSISHHHYVDNNIAESRNETNIWTYAEAALTEITKGDIAELRSYTNPPPAVVMVVSALTMLIFGKELTWNEAKRELNQSEKFYSALTGCQPEKLPKANIEGVHAYIRNSRFSPDSIQPICNAAAKICCWITAVYRAYQCSSRLQAETTLINKENVTANGNKQKARQKHKTSVVNQNRQMIRLSQTIGMTNKSVLSPQSESHSDNKAALLNETNIFTCQDGITKLPYFVLGDPDTAGVKINFVIFQDFFDNLESTKIFFRSIVAKHVGSQVLLFNFPGQADSSYPSESYPQQMKDEKEVLFNNIWMSHRVHELFTHLDQLGEFIFHGISPFHVVGFGNGGNIATCFVSRFKEEYSSTLKALIILNSFAKVDNQLAAILHSSVNVFSCFPPTRPDLPVSFFTQFLFSDNYLKNVDINLALSIYTAVTNAISLEGRVRICKGALNHADLVDELKSIEIPLVIVQSVENTLINPSNADLFLEGRSCNNYWTHQTSKNKKNSATNFTKQGKKLLRSTLNGHKNAFVIWLNSGHEIRQESKSILIEIFDEIIGGRLPAEEHDSKDTAIKFPKKINLNTEDPKKIPITLGKITEVQDSDNIEDEKSNDDAKLNTQETSGLRDHLKRTEDEYEEAMKSYMVDNEPVDPSSSINSNVNKNLFNLAYPLIPENTDMNTNLADNSIHEENEQRSEMQREIDELKRKLNEEQQARLKILEIKQQEDTIAAQKRVEDIRQEQINRRKQWEVEDNKLLSNLEQQINDRSEARESYKSLIDKQLQDQEEFMSTSIGSDSLYESIINKHISNENIEREYFDVSETKILKDDAKSTSLAFPDHDLSQPAVSEVTKDENIDNQTSAPVPTISSADKPEVFSSIFEELEQDEIKKKQQGALDVEEYNRVKMEMKAAHNERCRKAEQEENLVLQTLKNIKVVHIQKLARGYLARRLAKLKKETKYQNMAEFHAGNTIRRIGRGYIGRKIAKTTIQNQELKKNYNDKTLKIQSHFRGYLCRKGFKKKLRQIKAIEIQRVIRGFFGRTIARQRNAELELIKRHHESVVKIQSVWKMYYQRNKYLENQIYELGAVEIQRVFRGFCDRKKAKRIQKWQNSEPGPERLALGLDMINESKASFERQQNELNMLHQAQEQTEKRVSEIHTGLQESEQELAVLERELQEIDQIEADLQELTHEAEMLKQEGMEASQTIGSGIPTSLGHTAEAYGVETKEEARKRQAEAYALEMAIHIKKAEREKKKKELEAEFTLVFSDVQEKKNALSELENHLADMDASRMRKEREFARLQRTLMELLEEQKYELEMLKEKGIELETATATSAAAAAATAMKVKDHEKKSQAMFESTEELMKFQFMSMSLSYFSSINMLKNLRDLNADTTAAAVCSTTETAAAAAAAAAAANIPSVKKLKIGGMGMLDAASKKEKEQLLKKQREEEEAKASLLEPFPEKAQDWTVDDVSRWLDTLSLSQYKKAFREGAVDGEFLLELRPEDLSDVLGMEHKLHVRKVIVARNKLLPLSQQEVMKRDAVLHEESSHNSRDAAAKGIPDLDTVFSQARNGRLKRLTESIEAGFNPNTEDDKGNNLLSIACQNINQKMVEFLLLKDANINQQNAQGNTPLHFAMAYDTSGSLGEYLIDHGADDTLENIHGLSPYDGLMME